MIGLTNEEQVESNTSRINQLTEKINELDRYMSVQVEVNKHINEKFRKVWDFVNEQYYTIKELEERLENARIKIWIYLGG